MKISHRMILAAGVFALVNIRSMGILTAQDEPAGVTRVFQN